MKFKILNHQAILWGLFFILFTLLLGCENLPFELPFLKSQKTQKAKARPALVEDAVAQVGNFTITAEDLKNEIESYNNLVTAQGLPQNKIETREEKIAYLKNEVVQRYMLYQEALDRGLDKKPEIIKALENARLSLLVTELLRQEIEKIEVESKEIEDFYNQNKDKLREPEQRRIREMVVPAEAEAKEIYIELLKGADFAALAKERSKAKTAESSGDLGFISLELDPGRRIRPDKFYELAFSDTLEQGGISSIFKGPEGYYIIKLESIKTPQVKSLSELWDNIKTYLLYLKRQKAIADLASRLSGEITLRINEEKVE